MSSFAGGRHVPGNPDDSGQRPRTTLAPLPVLEDVDQLPTTALRAFLVECTAILAHAAARLEQQQADEGAVTAVAVAAAAHERRVRAPEAARIIGCSVRWLRQHGHELPSYRRDLNGRRVTWQPSALLAWIQMPGSW